MKTLVLKFLINTISKKELKILQKWLGNPKNREYFKEMIETNQRLDFAYRKIDEETAYRRIIKATSEKGVGAPKRAHPIFKYAAIVLLFIATSFGLYIFMHKNENVKIVSMPQVSAAESEIVLELEDGSLKVLNESENVAITNDKGDKVVQQEYNTLKYAASSSTETDLAYNKLKVPYGKRFVIELSDGTVVHLNAGTKLRYPKVFAEAGNRDVYLEGEAFFDVEENKAQPFVVHTQQMNVRVLGTKFNVSSYDNENSTSTVLVEGSVGVYDTAKKYSNADGVVISPNQQAKIQNGEFTVAEVDVQRFIAWMEGKLFFVNDRFEDIVKVLERNYNIKIINRHQELNDIRYTGTFQEKTLPEILNVFKRNTKFDYEIDNDSIVIIPSLP
ncbi:FecR domain-containing protein [uncultured Kriegella sp.]|uniref:FecR family protein n=1 Tax=uncultured Kriegella sp. TaxID=1798910 RepID=UPI0030DCF7E5